MYKGSNLAFLLLFLVNLQYSAEHFQNHRRTHNEEDYIDQRWVLYKNVA